MLAIAGAGAPVRKGKAPPSLKPSQCYLVADTSRKGQQAAAAAAAAGAVQQTGGGKKKDADKTESSLAHLLLSPEAHGTTMVSGHHVIQISLGADHGIMLTDQGLVFTWGDNRYCQLGRAPCLKEEEGSAFPVLSIVSDEITQVSAGKHHCLALNSGGRVWGWGRNKAGQLGVGDNRDKAQPVLVSHAPVRDGDAPEPLGTKSPILSISCGGCSSVASARNADIWQWGEISSEFKNLENKPAPTNRPHRVMDRESFRTNMRAERVALTRQGCRVIDSETEKSTVLIEDMVDSIREVQNAISVARSKLAAMESEQKEKEKARRKAVGDSAGTDQSNLTDTVALLEREVAEFDTQIELFKKNLKSCEQQQMHNKAQLEALDLQGAQLSASQDETSVMVSGAAKGGQQKRLLEETMGHIKEFMEANQNTRMTLLDQRAEIDKEKQHLTHELMRKNKFREAISKRLVTIKDLSKDHSNSSGASDWAVEKVSTQLKKLNDHYDNKRIDKMYVQARTETEVDENFLASVEAALAEMEELSSEKKRAKMLHEMGSHMIDLRRSLNTMNCDKWYKAHCDLSTFFGNSKKPTKPSPEDAKKAKDKKVKASKSASSTELAKPS